jgi:predicted unusual protein kinase regulating ubiquinone biosynthesis (AarF/ABC1/UbiB family)
MDLLNSLYRYITGDMEGIIGKINQHTNLYSPTLKDVPSADKVISRSLLDQLQVIPEIKHRGSIGVIYVSECKGIKIAVKTVLNRTKNKINIEIGGLKLVNKVKSNYKGTVDAVTDTLKKEIDMNLELKNCLLLHRYTENKKFRINFLLPLKQLCSKNEFVYIYDDGIPIMEIKNMVSKEKLCNIAKRIVLFTLNAIHNNGILIGDLNTGNILYNIKNDIITLIDYGCIVKLSSEQKEFAKEIHISQRNHDKLEQLINKWNGSNQLFNLIKEQSKPFMDLSGKKYDFTKIKTSINVFDKELLKLSMPSEIILMIRFSSQLVQLLKLLEINDNYAKSLYNLIDRKID